MTSTTTRIISITLATLALAAPAAIARPIGDSGHVRPSGIAGTSAPSQDLRSPDARDAAAGRGTFNAPDVAVVKLPQPAPVANDGIDWGDVGIGAGGAIGLALLALGGAFAVIHRRHSTRPMATTG